MQAEHILAIDQGTTSSRAIVFDRAGTVCGRHQIEFAQIFPGDGWVEHDAAEIWRTTVEACKGALAAAKLAPKALAAIGITNQRETTVLWDRADGRVLHNAIVWQDRRTAARCRALAEAGYEPAIQAKTGLLLDPYFSATKLAWLLDNVAGAREAANKGALAFGTIDCFVLWRLTGGRVHATDATNAGRTMLFDIHQQDWDEGLLELFDIPHSVLPEVRDSAGDFGASEAGILGAPVPITGIAGDQQAALVGQAAFARGSVKCTFGTGAFMLANTGKTPIASANRLLTTPAYRIAGQTHYALEGSVFVAGAAVQWLRDGLGLIERASDVEALAKSVPDTGGVTMVPAFTGLGAPYWEPEARGAIFGLTRDTGAGQIARATLDAVCYQSRDLLEAMRADGTHIAVLRVDGGMAENDWLMQRLADLLGLPVERPKVTETTALGAAFLAGLGCGLYASLDELGALWSLDRAFTPVLEARQREFSYEGWKDAVARLRGAR
jgi:glycerol kinase